MIIAEEGFPPVYPTNGMKKVTGALLAVPTGVEMIGVPGGDGGVGIEDGAELGSEDGDNVCFEVGDGDTVGMTVFATMNVKRASHQLVIEPGA